MKGDFGAVGNRYNPLEQKNSHTVSFFEEGGNRESTRGDDYLVRRRSYSYSNKNS